MATNAQIDLEEYLGKSEMKRLAEQAWLNVLHVKLGTEADAERMLTNNAYDIVGKLVEEKHHIDLERVLTEKVGKLISEDDSIKYILTQDHREYGSKRVGIVLSILEETIERNYRARLEQMADELINSINFKSKKFQKLVMEEVARIVAKRIQGGN